MSKREAGSPAKAHLSLWDTVSIILGIVIGAGIYETAPLVFQNVSSGWGALGVWTAGGLLSLIGALCYAELACAYPRSGGDYEYLTRAYGGWVGFLFGWSQLAVVMTGSIGMMAYIFADYANRIWSWGPSSAFMYAAAAVLFFSVLNLIGVLFGKATQNLLTLVKVLGIGAILVVGLGWSAPVGAAPAVAGTAAHTGSLGLAMILVLYTYGGWNDAAYVAAEVADKKRNIPRALILGTLMLTLIYVAVNAAYWWGLGLENARGSRAIAADLLERPLGGLGAKAMAVLVMVSALGAVNGLIYTGSRIYATVGEDFRWLSPLARWHPQRRTPVYSLVVQAVITLGLMGLVGTQAGRAGLNSMLGWVGASAGWESHGGFDTLLRCTAPIFWLFFLLTGIALFVLRARDPHRERPFRVPGYPVLPLIFCGMCVYMLWSATTYAGWLTLVGVVPVVLGLVLHALASRTGMARTRAPVGRSAFEEPT